MSTLRRQVGAMVRHHRERAGLTQAELADRVGKALETIGRIERGQAAPSFDTLESFAKVLEVDARDFFGSGEFAAKARRSDPLPRVLDRLAGLSDEDIEWADKLLTLALSRKA
ncbi:helix-turn-helix domain-containing protein [Caulobacter sp. 602-1]|uniref:helix-turn-helix domain-containing protein n=1 Tax=Caulobacter sp. 602-1 TaxID=2492472 RepID=UPI000F64047A|nr:helix-turn-helix transcriptional regulator [Caulobacter sp. 602-1]RRN63457.1 XRE family transcriptional regulator [Caulobacter sp. 602-1]